MRLTTQNRKRLGFTLIEIIIVVSILSILGVITILSLYPFNREAQLKNSAGNIANVLRLAQSKTLASEGASSYGVYFDTAASPNKYVLFKGNDYAGRDPSYDIIAPLSSLIEIYNIDLGGQTEVVFDRIVGTVDNPGSVSIRLKTDTTKTQTIYVDSVGGVSMVESSAPSGGRIQDSRHVEFTYGRVINTGNEILTLTFEGGVIQNIPIVANMQNGQIYWLGEVNVGGVGQRVEVSTHRLNDPDTLFSIRRDRRYNNVSLQITLSGDSSGYLLNYNSDGSVTTKQSIFASEPLWQ